MLLVVGQVFNSSGVGMMAFARFVSMSYPSKSTYSGWALMAIALWVCLSIRYQLRSMASSTCSKIFHHFSMRTPFSSTQLLHADASAPFLSYSPRKIHASGCTLPIIRHKFLPVSPHLWPLWPIISFSSLYYGILHSINAG